MLVLLGAGFVSKFLFGTLVFILSLFLILLVLVQRGKGGGLTGALGGMGGQSAFGTKAGDMFTRVTIVTAAIWILTCWFAGKYFSLGGTAILKGGGGGRSTINAVDGADETKASDKGAEKGTDEKSTKDKAGNKEKDDKSPGITTGGDKDTKASDESGADKSSTESSDTGADNTKTDESKGEETSTDSSTEEGK